jgi:hypothetical protein
MLHVLLIMVENNIAEKCMIIKQVLGVIIRPIDVGQNWTNDW